MIKVCKPFWSYDVSKTEEWLSVMSRKGNHLVKLNRWTRCFFFRQGESREITYRIDYGKLQNSALPTSLVDEGWIKAVQSGNWYIMSNEKPLEQIRSFSVREGVIKRNRLIMYLYSGLLIYFISIALIFLTLMSFVFSKSRPVEVVESPMWVVPYTALGVTVAIAVIAIYSIIKISITNKIMSVKKQQKPLVRNQVGERLSKEKERELKRSGQLVVKRKFGWMYAPDKLEEWLEKMEEQGFRLYRIGITGAAFYFIKGNPRKVSYCADYQTNAGESYSDIHSDAGWINVFSSPSTLMKWTIWSREYLEGEERPQIYSDKLHHLKHARKVVITYTVIFLPIIIINLFNLGLYIEHNSTYNMTNLTFISRLLLLFSLILLGSMLIRSWMYYMRLRQ